MKALAFILLLVTIPLVSSIGVAPASTEKMALPGESIEINIIVINNEAKKTTVDISVSGTLSDYAKLSDYRIDFKQGEKERNNKVIIDLPRSLEPGPHLLNLEIKERPRSDTQIGAFVKVVSRIEVFVPFDGKYVRIKNQKANFNPDETSGFMIEVENLGLQDVDNAKLTVDIQDEKLESESKAIESLTSEFFSPEWKPSKRNGRYSAEITANFDGQATRAEFPITIGRQELRLVSLDVKQKGQTQVDLKLVNEWNEPLTHGYAEVELLKNGELIANSPTVIKSFKAYGEETVQAYLETDDVLPGRYELKVTTHFLGSSREETREIMLTKEGPKRARKTWLYALIIVAFATAIYYLTKRTLQG